MARDNYYIVLELPFDPPEEDQDVIEERIRKKSRYWSKYAEDPNLGMMCNKYLNMVPEIRSVMGNPMKRKAEAREAARMTYAKIEKQLRIISKRGYLYVSEIKALANACKVEEALVRKVCTVKIVEEEERTVERNPVLSDIPESERPRFADRYDQAKPYLEALSKKDYYDFLNYTGNMVRLKEMPAKRLYELTNKREVRNAKHTAEESATEKLNKMCKDTFSSEEGKKDYDRYLLWNEIGEIFSQIKMATKVRKVLTKEQGMEAIRQMVEIQGDKEFCTSLLASYCNRYAVVWEGRQDTEKKEDTSLEKSEGNKPASKVETIQQPNGFIQQRIQCLKDYMAAGKYYAAKEELEQIKALESNFREDAIESKIRFQLNRAKKYLQAAYSARVERQAISSCMEVLEACLDYPGIQEALARFSVKPPSNFIVRCDSEQCCNQLQWEYNTEGIPIQFYIVRKHDTKPQTINDGELIGMTSDLVYSDKTIIPGDIYYYAVFANRLGVWSSGTVFPGLIQNLFEVADVRFSTQDKGVRVEWKCPAAKAKVEVYKQMGTPPKHAGEGMLYRNITPYGFVDYDVINERVYGYLIVAVYEYNNRKFYSAGKQVVVTPHAMLKEVEYVSVKAAPSRNRFFIEWEDTEQEAVRFYYSSQALPFHKGEKWKMAEIAMKAKHLQVTKNQPGKGIFMIEEGIYYVFAVSVKEEEGLIGATVLVVNQTATRVTGITNASGALHILCGWPEGAESLIVQWSKERYPNGIEDKNAQKIKVSKELFEHSKTIRIEKLVDQDYYFQIYACYRFQGEIYMSLGCPAIYRVSRKGTITYETKVRGKFTLHRKLELIFTGEEREFELPDLILVSAIGYPPAYKESGTIIGRIPARKVIGSFSYVQSIEQLPKNAYVKVFVEQKQVEQTVSMCLKYGSKSKIS